jgi:hypothetical protein
MSKHEEKPTTNSKLEGFAEDLGEMLGNARAKAEGWLSQRHAVVKHLSEIRDTASKLLADLGHEAARTLRRGGTPGRPPGTRQRGPGRPARAGKRKRTMSAEARARISAAQKARWAKQKAGEKKK